MFTGIIQAVGRIERNEPLGEGRRLRIHAPELELATVGIGDSIAINGACMTVVARDEQGFEIEVSAESLARTAGLEALGKVNLEKAMRVGDRLDGHIVSGHVDGRGRVVVLEPVAESWHLVVHAPPELSRYLAYKGSITVNGVSLTVNRVEDVADGTRVHINLIPHTVQVTTLGELRPGDAVNLEIDTIARYVERMLACSAR
jgi:riboflavin synthase